MNIRFNDLLKSYEMYQEEYEKKALEVLRSGWYILGNEVRTFESEFAAYVGTKHCVGLASGLDALVIAMRALNIGEGDEVIVQANTYIASIMGISMNGAIPVFVEPNEFHNIDARKIEEKITEKTKAILVVHLYGQATNMMHIQKICKENDLFLIEDCAQSHGATYNGIQTGMLGDIGCFSFYPSKNLGAFGDAGAITTNNADLDAKIRVLRNYGSEKRYHNQVVGYNSRLDELQAGLLNVKLKHIDELNAQRAKIANRYLEKIRTPKLRVPKLDKGCTMVWHLFVVVVEERDAFMSHLEENGVQALIHYPIPPHLSEAYKYLGVPQGAYPITEKLASTVVSLPLYNGMTLDEADYVIDVINKF